MKIVHLYNPYGAAHQTPTKIVIHAMAEYVFCEGEYVHAPEFLKNQSYSVHAIAAPDGTIYRCRNDDEGAYHARGFNAGTLGIEVLLAGKHDYESFERGIKTPYVTDAQYQATVEQCREWMHLHNITEVVRHSDLSPGRKVDPGNGFPWKRFLFDLRRHYE